MKDTIDYIGESAVRYYKQRKLEFKTPFPKR